MMVMIIILAVLGVIFGSFVNALVWRLHEQAELGTPKTKAARQRLHELSVLKGRSMCPHCQHTLAAKDLIPVLSWLSLKGKCRYCQAPISWQYPAVELLTSALFAVSYLSWPYSMQGGGAVLFGGWLACLVLFVALAVYDLRWFILPNRLVLPLTILAASLAAVEALWLTSGPKPYEPLLGAAIIFGLFWGLFQVSGGRWIGGGDVKMALALGLLAGTPAKAFLVIFGSSLIGTLASIPLLAKGKQGLTRHVPFGPYLLLATYLTVLYGDQVIDWYRRLLLV